MATDDHVLDLQNFNRILEYRQQIHIIVNHKVSYISVNEYLSRLRACNLVGGDAAVRAAYPKILGMLTTSEMLEILWIFSKPFLNPRTIAFQQTLISLLHE